MREVEAKILDIDLEAFKTKIEKLGARPLGGRILMREFFLEPPSYNEETAQFSSCRLRQEGEHAFFTVKKRVANDEAVIRDEHQVEVSNFDTFLSAVELLGFTVFRRREKYRETYELKEGVKIEIDLYPQMQPYAEIEATSEEALWDTVAQLGYSKEETSAQTATELIRSMGLNPDSLMFEEN